MMPPSIPIPFAIADNGSSMVESGAESRAKDSSPPEPMEEAAFQAWYQETGPALRSYIRRACGDAALADDILQETFYRFLRARLPKLEPPQRKAYLYRTATSLLSDHWRRQKRERRWRLTNIIRGRLGSKAASSEGTESAEGTAYSEDSEWAETAGLRGDIMQAFRQLKPQQQALLWLAYVEGFDHREISNAMKLKDKSVRVLLFRARNKMARILTEQGFGPQEGL